jgi:uncharacterized protein (DUF983 family)
MSVKKKMEEPVAAGFGNCPKCEAMNSDTAKFCNTCGAQLQVTAVSGVEGLVSLHVVVTLYVFISLVVNALIQASLLFLSLYVVTGVLAIVGVSLLQMKRGRRWAKFVSVAMIGVGLVGTFLFWLIGLAVSGVVGPAWVIFIVTIWQLWRDRRSL